MASLAGAILFIRRLIPDNLVLIHVKFICLNLKSISL